MRGAESDGAPAGPPTRSPDAGAVALRDAAGPFVRPLQRVVRGLATGSHTIPELVALSGAPRREVEQILAALAPDLERDGDRHALPEALRAAYAELFDLPDLDARPFDDVVGTLLAGRPDLVAFLEGLAGSRPRPLRDLDHVAATPVTVARRALWLDASFDLARTEVLCLGDHDLTSLGIAACTRGARIAVVDVDDRVLDFVDGVARRHGWSVRCLWGDLRLGLPVSTHRSAGLVVTDPPYTPDGISTFLVAGLQGLADGERGRLVVAYGYGDHQPALGLTVQHEMLDLHLVVEAVLPGFNRYQGAQAIGSRSDLYVLRPTARTWRALPGLAGREAGRIYTHGSRSVESRAEPAGAALEQAMARAAGAAGTDPGPLLLVGDRWPGPAGAGVERTSLGAVLARGLPRPLRGRDQVRCLVDLTEAPPAWFLRALLALDVAWLGAVVPAGVGARGDVATAADLLRDRYRLRRESFPAGRFDLVVATPAGAGSRIARDALRRAHGRLGNAWREALIAAAGEQGGRLTKNEARGIVERFSPRPDLTDLRLVEAPRHLLELAVTQLRASQDHLAMRAAAR
ncbi:MAG TPA: bis-aminopropyl spermidine synthase family protein [Kineosporiaceae bacterium]|nr:bis-aminopropyl spermidine synthase family protein [Kineosporiaceae bacterium]